MNPEWTNFAFAFVIHVLITSHHAMLTQGTCFIFFPAMNESSTALGHVKSLVLHLIWQEYLKCFNSLL